MRSFSDTRFSQPDQNSNNNGEQRSGVFGAGGVVVDRAGSTTRMGSYRIENVGVGPRPSTIRSTSSRRFDPPTMSKVSVNSQAEMPQNHDKNGKVKDSQDKLRSFTQLLRKNSTKTPQVDEYDSSKNNKQEILGTNKLVK